MRKLAVLLAALVVAAAGATAQAQQWRSKPVRVIVNFPPGGAADQTARGVAPPLGEALGQPIVVESRPGANGNIGAEAVAKSPPDGFTLLMSSGGAFSVNPHLYTKLPFDPLKDLESVAAAARILVFLVVRPDLPANSLFPDAPPVAETGMVGFDADSWFGFYAPAGLPVDVATRLNREINRALQTPAVRDRIRAIAGEPVAMSAAEFTEVRRKDRERFGTVIRASGIKLD